MYTGTIPEEKCVKGMIFNIPDMLISMIFCIKKLKCNHKNVAESAEMQKADWQVWVIGYGFIEACDRG